jgi:cytoskeletal protein CcmA (bactofilin family)
MLIVEADMMVVGQLTLLGAARIDGRFEGSLVCRSIEVGPDGYVEGTLVAEDITIAGQLVGAGWGRRIHLAGTAIVEGELHQEQLSMDEKASLVGESRRQARFEMPAPYRNLLERERRAASEFEEMSAEARVRRAAEADQSRVAFQQLRARFPAPRVAG